MIDLKGPYDVLNKALTARDQKAAEISALLDQGTDEAVSQALALQDSLDTLQADLDQKKALYDKLVHANAPSDVAQLFVPASQTATEEDKPKVMKRSEFDALSHVDRAAYIKDGGTLED